MSLLELYLHYKVMWYSIAIGAEILHEYDVHFGHFTSATL